MPQRRLGHLCGKAFSKESGQVYVETLQRGCPMTSEWVWKTLGSSLQESGRFQSRLLAKGPGCASLSNMAIRSVMMNMMSVTVDSLRGVPWHVGKKLWDRIRKCRLESVHIWKVFATVYVGINEETLKNKSHIVLNPNGSFKSYIEPLISPSFHWLTFLSISHLHCSRTDLIQLFQLTNLGVLSVGQGVNCSDSGIGLDDSIIRSWARASTSSSGSIFPCLRVLNCAFQQALSFKILSYLKDFPALALFTFDHCPGIHHGPKDKTEAKKLGWRYKTGAELSVFLAQSGATTTTTTTTGTCTSWDEVSRASFRGCGPFSVEKKICAEGVDTLPVLHFGFGNKPEETVMDGARAQSLKAFYRVKDHVPPPLPTTTTADIPAPAPAPAPAPTPTPASRLGKGMKKRPLEEQKPGQQEIIGATITPSARKKLTIKASKQQSMNDMLMGFYS